MPGLCFSLTNTDDCMLNDMFENGIAYKRLELITYDEGALVYLIRCLNDQFIDAVRQSIHF